MSKVVRAVAGGIASVVKGVVKAVKKVVTGTVNLVKKVAQSKFGKIILTAAAVYFGGAALAGGFGSSAAGGSFLSGMGTGVANAASSLSSAWTSALSGNFSAAGSSLSAGFQGSTTALQAADAAAAATTAAGTAGTTPAMSGGFAPTSSVTAGQVASTLPATTAPASTGLIGGLSPMGQYAAIAGTTQLVGGAIQGYGAQKAQEDQRNYEAKQAEDARTRYNANVGTRLWGDAQTTGNEAPAAAAAAYDPVAEARAIGERSRAEFNARYGAAPAQAGMIGRTMGANPMTNNNFPVYNPAYARG